MLPWQALKAEVAPADVTLNGSAVGDGVLPVANPKLNLNDYAFNIVKVSPIFSPLSQGSMHA